MLGRVLEEREIHRWQHQIVCLRCWHPSSDCIVGGQLLRVRNGEEGGITERKRCRVVGLSSRWKRDHIPSTDWHTWFYVIVFLVQKKQTYRRRPRQWRGHDFGIQDQWMEARISLTAMRMWLAGRKLVHVCLEYRRWNFESPIWFPHVVDDTAMCFLRDRLVSTFGKLGLSFIYH